ncbi:CCA tRNA nucleotidyltransferase [Campylobacter sp. RM16190]|uniref:CCA tRNA nucleotidyltransferase n=1 Tax=Campylobacter sp. RM16190 TaxID=1705727 RepID=UPI001474668E|nr:CCA tRNA nucleotidyltransferase [Campylobacter sp. RM16190]
MLKTGLIISKLNELNWVRNLLGPYTKRAYVVGGSVRDIFLGRKITDFDIEIYDISPCKFDQIMKNHGASGVGKSYFVYKLNGFDLSLPRTENKVGEGHKAFDVNYCNDEKGASMRRDFTVNSIMINIFDGKILDFWGGLDDIKKGVLRHIDDEKFCEDSLRVLRGVQFSARFDFKISQKTLNLMKTISLKDLSKDRISGEMLKLFNAKFQSTGAKYLYKLGLFKELFGLKLSKNKLINFQKKLISVGKFKKDQKEFLYLLREFGLQERVVKDLNLPNSFISVFREPFFKGRVSDKDLLRIAIKMPLRDWLGLNSASLVRRAKKFGIYDSRFEPLINIDEILRAGFKNEAIGIEILRRQNLAIDEFLKNKF